MKHLFSASQSTAMFAEDGRDFEVMATAEAFFDETDSLLLIELDSFVRTLDLQIPGDFKPDWLPRTQNLREHVSSTEASSLAREIFHRWARTVRQTADKHIAVTRSCTPGTSSKTIQHA